MASVQITALMPPTMEYATMPRVVMRIIDWMFQPNNSFMGKARR